MIKETLLASAFGLLGLVTVACGSQKKDLMAGTDYVNPFIGTGGHEITDFILIYFYFFEFVNNLQQLLLADLLAGRHFSLNEFLADDAFDFTHFAFFAQVDDGDGCACFSGTSRTSAA